MFLKLYTKTSGILFYSEIGWYPNCSISFSLHGNQIRAHTTKRIPERIIRHAVNIYKKHFIGNTE